MKPQLSILLIIMNLTSMFGQEVLNENLIYVKEGNKIGFINFNGKEIIPVEFDAVKSFSEDILPVNKGAIEKDYESVGGKWGFWNREGKEIIPIKYEDAQIFREGLAPVKLNGKYGFINLNDEVILDFKYEDAKPFREGFAAVKIEGKWGFIDKKGNIVISPKFHRVEDFDNGFSIVFHLITEFEYEDDGYRYKEEEGKYGLIDRSGLLKLDTIYDHIDKFENGFAKIELERKEGFINSDGEIAIPIQFDKVEKFSEGLAVVANFMLRDSYHDFGYQKEQIDSLEIELGKLYEKIGDDFSTDDINMIINHPTYIEFQRAKMQEPSKELMHGYINEKGTVVIDFQFDEAEAFKNGLAKVRFGRSPMFSIVELDENGNRLPSYQEQIGIGANLIDKNGNLQLEKNKQILNRYGDNIFVTYTHMGAGAFNENLEEVIPNQYQNLSYIGYGLFVGELEDSQKKVLLTNDFKLELDENYWSIENAFGNRILVDYIVDREKNRVITKSGIINKKGEWILEPKYDFSMVEFKRN
ncbi:MAG: WG repeat-containing protein [Bacteroidia bacterium]|nr:WG repeat-containing protein [Bacteroidia bacterium]